MAVPQEWVNEVGPRFFQGHVGSVHALADPT